MRFMKRFFQRDEFGEKKELLNANRKLLMFYQCLVDWTYVLLSRKTIATYFKERDYKSVVIYGMKELGDLLLKELDSQGIDVVCGVDKNAKYIVTNVPMISPDEDFPDVDVIVVTAIANYDEIVDEISNKVNCPIVSLQVVIKSVFDYII